MDIEKQDPWQIGIQIQKALVSKKKTLVLAESCTGGLLSHLITIHAGASDCFLGSLVTYSDEMKQTVLGVKEQTLSACGAVSKETVAEMAQGALRLSGADFAVAVSGVAGPTGGTQKVPVGTVFFAIAEKGETAECGSFLLNGDRKNIIITASVEILSLLYRKIN